MHLFNYQSLIHSDPSTPKRRVASPSDGADSAALCRRPERAHPAVAVPAGAALGQVGAALHRVDGQQLGVQDVRPRRGEQGFFLQPDFPPKVMGVP